MKESGKVGFPHFLLFLGIRVVKISIEIRYANEISPEDVYELKEVPKEEALLDRILLAMETLKDVNPSIAVAPYSIVPSVTWNNLPETLFWFKEEEADYYALCAIRSEEVGYPMANLVSVFLVFPPEYDIPNYVAVIAPTMGDIA